jgi:hypothetical protein
MKAFFERNKPVFTIGLITLIIFLGLILSYELKSHNNLTGLKKLGNDSSVILTEEEIAKEQEVKQASESAQSQAQAEAQIDATLGIVNIEFANSGWVPILVDVAKNQKVVWTNKTDKEILLRQRTPTYDSFTEPVKIGPGKSYEMRMTVIGDWNYDESQSNYFATIRVF